MDNAKIVCIGDSITFGYEINDLKKSSDLWCAPKGAGRSSQICGDSIII